MILTVKDSDRIDLNDWKSRTRYTSVFIDTYEPKFAGGRGDNVHGITVIKPIKPILKLRPEKLRGQRVYPLIVVYHGFHIMPIDENDKSSGAEMYVNDIED